MFKRLLSLSLLLLALGAVAGIALGAENNSNLCDGAWAGECDTQREWEAGWCYANQPANVCNDLYGDVASHMVDEFTQNDGASDNQGGGATATSAMSQQQAQQFTQWYTETQLPQQQAQAQQGQQNNQSATCTPSITYTGQSGGNYNFTVNTCGIPLSAPGDWTLATKLGHADSADGLCTAGLYHLADAYGNPIGNQLYYYRSDNCYDNDKTINVSGQS